MAAQAEQQQREKERRDQERSRPKLGKGLGGLLGGLAKHAAEQKAQASVEAKLDSASADSQSTTIMKMTTEVLRVSMHVDASDLALPGGLRRIERGADRAVAGGTAAQ